MDLQSGVYHAGYEQFGLMRSDPALCFRALCGEEPRGTKKKKKRLAQKALAAAKKAMASVKPSGSEAFVPDGAGDDSEMSESGEESEGEGEGDSAPPTPAATNTKRCVHVCRVTSFIRTSCLLNRYTRSGNAASLKIRKDAHF